MKGVYKIEDSKGRLYIGSTSCFSRRTRQHLSRLRNGKHHSIFLQRAFNMYGENHFKFEMIEECENLFEREQYYIDTLNPVYNMGSVGGGDNLSNHPYKEEIRRKMVETVKRRYASGEITCSSRDGKNNPNWKGAINTTCSCGRKKAYKAKTCNQCRNRNDSDNPFYGKLHNEETKQKLSEHRIGRKPSNTRKVYADGVIYESCAECAKAKCISNGLINYRIKSPKYDYHYVS